MKELSKTNPNDVKKLMPLLVEIEKIIGSSFYNGNIQNYGPGGFYEGEGRDIRYPVTVIKDGEKVKISKYYQCDNYDSTVLATGRYRLGANELHVFSAAFEIVKYLHENFDLDVTHIKKKLIEARKNRLKPSR